MKAVVQLWAKSILGNHENWTRMFEMPELFQKVIFPWKGLTASFENTRIKTKTQKSFAFPEAKMKCELIYFDKSSDPDRDNPEPIKAMKMMNHRSFSSRTGDVKKVLTF
jgi:hypothetical protein